MESMPDMFTTANAALVAVTMAVISGARTVFPWMMEGGHWRERLLPMLPIPIAIIASFMGVGSTNGDWAQQLKVGLIAGLAAGHLWKVANTTMRGKGVMEKAPATPADPGEGV